MRRVSPFLRSNGEQPMPKFPFEVEYEEILANLDEFIAVTVASLQALCADLADAGPGAINRILQSLGLRTRGTFTSGMPAWAWSLGDRPGVVMSGTVGRCALLFCCAVSAAASTISNLGCRRDRMPITHAGTAAEPAPLWRVFPSVAFCAIAGFLRDRSMVRFAVFVDGSNQFVRSSR